MKYSMLMPYYIRSIQLENTLQSLNEFYEQRSDLEIIIVEDYKNIINKDEHKKLIEIIDHHSNLSIIKLERPEEQIYNPAPHYNQAAKEAHGDYLIITNPECKHVMDILDPIDHMFETKPNSYIVCSCHNDEPFFWLQHTTEQIYNAGCLHWCSAISKNNYFSINGFDDIYKNGAGCEDDDFRNRISKSNIEIIPTNDLIVCHQSHESPFRNNTPGMEKLWAKNRSIYYSRM